MWDVLVLKKNHPLFICKDKQGQEPRFVLGTGGGGFKVEAEVREG